MIRFGWLGWLLTAVAILVVACLACSFQAIGHGRFYQDVIIEADNLAYRLTYCCVDVDDEWRQRAEATADPRLCECVEAAAVARNTFATRIPLGMRWGPCIREKVSHPPHLVVYVEFIDGTRFCRVVDLPPGRSQGPIVLELR